MNLFSSHRVDECNNVRDHVNAATEDNRYAKRLHQHRSWTGACCRAGVAATPAWADPPEGKGKGWGKGKGNERAEQQASPAKAPPAPAAGSYFIDRHRAEVRTYYAAEQRRGSCPPGLAKKNNGCMPPGQAKKWQVGRPLPRDVVIYDLPPALVIKIGMPPAGHKYVRVAVDVLLIAIGTSMVVDAIRDLGQL